MRIPVWTTARVVRALLTFGAWHPRAFAAILGLGLLASLAEGLGIGLFIPFLKTLGRTDGLVEGSSPPIEFLAQLFATVPVDQRLFVISLCILGSIVLSASLTYAHAVLRGWLKHRIGHEVRTRVFEQLLLLNYRFLERDSSGRLMNVLATQTWETIEAFSSLLQLLIMACIVVVFTAMLLVISWPLTLLVVAAMLAISLTVRSVTRRTHALGRRVATANETLAQRMIEGLEGMSVIRAFGRESYERDRFGETSRRVSDAFTRVEIRAAAVHPLYEVLAGLLLVGIVFGTLRAGGDFTTLLVFAFLLYRLQPRIRALDTARVHLAALAAAVEDVVSLLDNKEGASAPSGSVPFKSLTDSIRFDSVTFRYDASDEPALRSVSIRFRKSTTTALVGPSGAGKSTLIKLILRLYERTSGEIYVDDQPLHLLQLASWRSRIALVSQDVYMFNASVSDNIRYGRLEAREEDIIAAAKLANAHEFISALPRGYDTPVGDRGVRLSGGERQRITLARAIVRDPQILILDEATNELDSLSEQLIQQALETVFRDRTVIVIAHRLSTIQRSHQIVVLDKGQVTEQGDLQHLLALDGLFAKLYHVQYGAVSVR